MARGMWRLVGAAVRLSASRPTIAPVPMPSKEGGIFWGRGCASIRGMATAPAADLHKKEGEYNIKVKIERPYKLHKLQEEPAHEMMTSKEELLKYFRLMQVMRRMEIASDGLYKSGLVRGFCHLYDGQEAIAVGTEAALTWDDPMITAYREHCNYLARGATIVQVLGELCGRVVGCSRGKGGSMHMYHKDHNYYGGTGIVGTSAPLGTGLGFSVKYRGQPNVAMAMYGDGAANQGQIYEVFNMAALWKLPVIYVVENNKYGMGTSVQRASAQQTYYDRVSYIPGIELDGQDVFQVKAATEYAKAHCLADKGPIILELDTYRYHGHSMSDPGSSYRQRDEIKEVRQQRDPIEHVKNIILENKLATPEDLKAIEKEARREVEEAVEEVKKSPEPDTKELFDHVYAYDKGIKVYGCDRKTTVVVKQ